MVYDGVLEGKYVDLKSCTEDDAEFTRAIRKDPQFADCFPAFDNTIEEQRAWIRKQRIKEGDYFFVVWDKQGNRIGTISVYDVNGNHAESGRLAIKAQNPFQPLEAQILCFRFAFGYLKLECIDGYIFADNERAIRYNKQFGGKQYTPEPDETGRLIVRFENWRSDFEKVDQKFSRMLYRDK